MNARKAWVTESRKKQARAPERYLASYPELVMDEDTVLMTQTTFDKIKHHCGTYDGTWPSGEYLGKMFLRHGRLFWIGISKEHPMTHIAWNSREIVVVG